MQFAGLSRARTSARHFNRSESRSAGKWTLESARMRRKILVTAIQFWIAIISSQSGANVVRLVALQSAFGASKSSNMREMAVPCATSRASSSTKIAISQRAPPRVTVFKKGQPQVFTIRRSGVTVKVVTTGEGARLFIVLPIVRRGRNGHALSGN